MLINKLRAKANLASLVAVLALTPLSVVYAQKAKTPPTAAAKTPTKSQNWLAQASFTPEGGVVVGNPKAALHLVEYASLTCTHCQDFAKEAMEPLKTRFIATGKLRYELRPILRNSADYLASLLVRCQGPAIAFKHSETLLLEPEPWQAGFLKLNEEDFKPLQNLPPIQVMQSLVRLSALDAYFAARGLPMVEQQQCLANKAHYEALERAQKQAFNTDKIKGTPSFVLNGQLLSDANNWPALEAKLTQMPGTPAL